MGDSASPLHVLEKVETSQQFFAWFGQIESQMDNEQESSYHKYAELLKRYSERCGLLLHEIDNALGVLTVRCFCYCCPAPCLMHALCAHSFWRFGVAILSSMEERRYIGRESSVHCSVSKLGGCNTVADDDNAVRVGVRENNFPARCMRAACSRPNGPH